MSDPQDLGAVGFDDSIFGPAPFTEELSDEPQVRGGTMGELLAGEYRGFPFKPAPGPLSRQQEIEIEAVVQAMARLFYNTQLTAALPAHNAPTNWSDPVDRSGVVTIPAAADLEWTTITDFLVGPGRWMRLTGYGIAVREAGYTYNGSLVWRLTVDGLPLPSLEEFAEQRGTPIRPREVFAIAKQDQRVALQVRRAVASADANTVEGVFTGYTWRLRNDFDGTRASVSAY